jgi:hypothetical protein
MPASGQCLANKHTMNNIYKLLEKIPFLRYAALYKKNCSNRPGHFYSPVVDLEDLQRRADTIWKTTSNLPGIDLNEAAQAYYFQQLQEAYPLFDFPEHKQPDRRYYFDNNSFPFPDGVGLFAMLRCLQPRQIVEVGCGYSSALMLDCKTKFLEYTQFHFIEPFPDFAFNKLLQQEDRSDLAISFTHRIVQSVDLSVFEALNAGDLLFIDNSHVSKTGSDVNFVFGEVLPRLKPGVFIHIHDIFYPFEYPKEWLLKHKLNWNEIYLLRSFLSFSDSFKIVFFPDYLLQQHRQLVNDTMPGFAASRPGSIWLQKMQ